jgi:ribosomal protein S18 acetylase RimI-like enzyme
MPWRLGQNQVFMYRPDLRNIPEAHLPPGYQELESDEETLPQWVDVLDQVFGGYSVAELSEGILSEPQWSPERVMLAAKDGRPVAISLAWEERQLWPHSGHVYWVAVLEDHRRRGLGRFVLTRALQYFTAHGYQDAVVYTEHFRGLAINLYLELGFVPLITGTVSDERERWQRALSEIGRPELMAAIRDDYESVAGRAIAKSFRSRNTHHASRR